MKFKDKLDLNNSNFLDFIVDYRLPLVTLIMVATVVFAFLAPKLPTDPTLRSGLDTTSESYKEYQKFVEEFGDEEFILVALRNEIGATDPKFLASLASVTKQIQEDDKLTEVVSLSSLKLFQKKGGKFGNLPVIQQVGGQPELPDAASLKEMKRALPTMELLISNDLKTLGILVRLDERWKFDTPTINELTERIKGIVAREAPPQTDCRIVGSAMIRNAIVRYNVQTGVIFGALCMLIGAVVSMYIFKSFKITAVTNLILAICVLWVLGLMALLKIPLNSTTALSFGFIPITTVEIVIHMVVRFRLFYKETNDKLSAIKKAVRWLARPCLICSATTAVGFGTLMVSSIPMVRQLGFIMSFGIMISCCLALALTPAFFIRMKSITPPKDAPVLRDSMDGVLNATANAIFKYHKFFVGLGIVITALFFAGAPFIKSDTQILRMLSEKTPEVKDIHFVERHLTAVHGLELVIEGKENDFKKPEMWERVAQLDKELKKIPEVVTVDSFVPLLTYIYNVSSREDGPSAFSDPINRMDKAHHDVAGSAESRQNLFSDPTLIPQLLMITSLSAEGERITGRHLDSDFSKLHISIRIKNSPDVPIGRTIEDIRRTSTAEMAGTARAVLTGELTVVADQTGELIKDQIKSMILAAVLITILMMIQMESAILGLICLVPNIPPVAAVFGIMGWFGISLDSVTIFAATVAIGLAVDNTIHFLTQLKREISISPGLPIPTYVGRAYNLTARQIASWSVVTLLGFLALSVSPFRPVVFFGILGCSSIVLGLFGDLIFMQSLILTSATIRNTIKNLVERETSDGGLKEEQV